MSKQKVAKIDNSNLSPDSNLMSEEKSTDDFQEITLFKNPLQTMFHLILIFKDKIESILQYLKKNYFIPVIIIIYFLLMQIENGPHREVCNNLNTDNR